MKFPLANHSHQVIVCMVILALSMHATWSCDLKIENAWIREAPPNMMTLAGYAQLTNTGKKPLEISAVESPAFMEVQLHESTLVNGVAGMRQLDKLVIPVNGKAAFEPHGKHFMMMGMKRPLKSGDKVPLEIKDSGGCITHAEFIVSKEAP